MSLCEYKYRNMSYGGVTGAPATGVQPLKYGGKELDRENGLDWLDFEARHYDPMLPHFNSMDRKAEDYSSTSPYAYCAANPIRFTDPTGMNPVYDRNGIYLGDTSEGFTGEVLVMRDGYAGEIDVNKMTSEELQEKFYAFTLDDQQHYCDPLSGDALSNIWTNILSHFEGTEIDGEVFSMNRLVGGKVYYMKQNPSEKFAFKTFHKKGVTPTMYGSGYNYLDFESTVENLAITMLYHEWYGHGIMDYGDATKDHNKAYGLHSKNYPLWLKSTIKFKLDTISKELQYIYLETTKP